MNISEKAIKMFKETNDLTEKICNVIKNSGYNIDVVHATIKGLNKAIDKEMEEIKND